MRADHPANGGKIARRFTVAYVAEIAVVEAFKAVSKPFSSMVRRSVRT